MSTSQFCPFITEYIIAKFHCVNCGSAIETNPLFVPEISILTEEPECNYLEGKNSTQCILCEKKYFISIKVGYRGGRIFIQSHFNNEDISIKEILQAPTKDDFLKLY